MATNFKVKRNLTPPLLKFAENEARYIKVTSKVYIGKEMKIKEGEKKREPAHIVDCVNLETGEQCQIIVYAVVASVWSDEYPNDGYVGKGFAITKQGRVLGKAYNKFSVEEIELPDEVKTPSDVKTSAATTKK
jgi:hypothetical protein